MSRLPSPIAIVGMGCRFPGSPNIPAYWRTIRDGKVWLAPVPRSRWNHDLFYSRDRGFRDANKTYVDRVSLIDGPELFAPEAFGIAPKRARIMDPQQRLFLDVVRAALEDAGYAKRELKRDRVGTFVGACVSDFMDLVTVRMRATLLAGGEFGAPLQGDEIHNELTKNVVPLAAHTVVGSLLNMVAANVNQAYDFGGPAFSTDAACSSALVALHEAMLHLRHGTCDTAIVGGVYMVLSPDNVLGFSRIGAVSEANICRPFDQRADGFVVGEGIGAVVCKRLETALADKDRIYAVIPGMGMNNDGRGDGPMTPRKEGQLAVLERAHQDSGIAPSRVEVVEAHGTATPVGDATEVAALAEFRGDTSGRPCALSSAKANIGHSMSAAGIAGLIRATLAVHHATIPMHASYEQPRADLRLHERGLYIPNRSIPWQRQDALPRTVGVSSFGFGGTNCHVIVQEPSTSSASTTRVFMSHSIESPPPRPELFLLSAPTADLLCETAVDLLEAFVEQNDVSLAGIAASLASRTASPHRAAFIASSHQQFIAALRWLAAPSSEAPSHIHLNREPVGSDVPKLAMLFPGQGAQKPDMARPLYERFGVFREALDALTADCAIDGRALLSYLYPTNGAREKARATLSRTEICQPLMASLGLASAAFFDALGVRAHAVAGHSLGEFAAAAAAGILPAHEAVQLVARRGALMASMALPDSGAMLALSTDAATAQRGVSQHDGWVVANINHARQTVIAGPRASCEAVATHFRELSIKAVALDVSHAFHSPLMDGITQPFTCLVKQLPLGPAKIPFVSAVEPSLSPLAPEQLRAAWTRHATAPVDFIETVRSLHEQGCRVFLQVTGGHSLLNMARHTLAHIDPSCSYLAVTQDEGDGSTTCLETLARFYTLGFSVDARGLEDPAADRTAVSLPPSRLQTRALWPVKRETVAATPHTVSMPNNDTTPMTQPKPQEPAVGGMATESPATRLKALFAQQMALMDAHVEIIRKQNELLAQAAQSPAAELAPLRPAAPATSAPPVVQAAAVAASVFEQLRGVVSRIAVTPIEGLHSRTRLGADLGFDSLMITELSAALTEAFNGLTLPRRLFETDLTLGTLEKEIRDRVQAPEPATKVAQEIRLFEPKWVARPLRRNASTPSENGAVVLLSAGDDWAPALAKALEQRGRTVRATSSVQDPSLLSAHVIDLRLLSIHGTNDAVNLLQSLRQVAQRRPSTWHVLAHTQNAAPVGGFLRSLSHEAYGAQLGSVALDDDVTPSPEFIEALVQTLLSGKFDEEVRFTVAGGLGPLSTQFHAHALPSTFPSAAGVLLISGATGSIGGKLARHYACSQASLALLGRKPADAPDVSTWLAELRSLGAKVHYASCDITDASAVNKAVLDARAALGPITACLHAAGETDDHPVHAPFTDATAAVVATKVDGAENLWNALQNQPLITFVALGSWAARFGNRHQTTYAFANALLASVMSRFESTRPQVRCCVLELPAWRGTGMVTKLPVAARVQLESQVETLADSEGVNVIAAALSGALASGTYVVARRLPPIEETFGWTQTLAPDAPGYLSSHVIAARPVLPLAGAIDLMLPALAHQGIKLPLALRDVEVVQGVVLEGGSATVLTRVRNGEAGTIVETIRLDDRNQIGFRATLGVIDDLQPVQLGDLREATFGVEHFYQHATFHGPALRPLLQVRGVSQHAISALCEASSVEGGTTLVSGLDGVLQVFAFWSAHTLGRAGLPLAIDAIHILRQPVAHEVLYIEATVATNEDGTMRGDADVRDEHNQLVFRLRGFKGEPRDLTRLAAGRSLASARVLPERETVFDAPLEHTSVQHFPEVQELARRITAAKTAGMQIPYFRAHDGINGATASLHGRSLLNFSSYNYLGFSGHPEVTRAAQRAIEKFGSSVSASRIASGERPLHQQLERALAKLLGSDDALVMVGGHATNVSIIGHLLGPADLVIHDSLAHDSILGGARLSGARRRPFPHNNVDALRRMLRESRTQARRVLLAVEGVYSMDGDLAPLDKLIELKRQYGCLLLVDEAHSLGVIGPTGAGVGEHFGVNRGDVDLWMGTLSKSLASCGGYVAGARHLIEYLRYSLPGFIYSVGISPANAAAALAALDLMERQPETVARLQERCRYFLTLCEGLGINTGPSRGSAIVPCIVGNSALCMQLSQALLARGINVQPIVYPAVEEDQARLRFFICATHTEEQLRQTANALAQELFRLQPPQMIDAIDRHTVANGG